MGSDTSYAALMLRDGPSCYLCGQPDDLSDPLEVEHVKPRSAGGSDALSNLALAHRSCNRAKATHAVPR